MSVYLDPAHLATFEAAKVWVALHEGILDVAVALREDPDIRISRVKDLADWGLLNRLDGERHKYHVVEGIEFETYCQAEDDDENE